MKINEILVESQQLDEGPLGSTVKAVGTGVGKAVGGVAKGVGAVAGGIAGIGKAVKKGFQAGKATVAGDNEEDDTVSRTSTAAPTKAADINKQGPAGTAPAKQQTDAAAQAMQKTAQASAGADPEQVGQTLYAQVKSQVTKLDKKGKQRILNLLQKSLGQTPPATTKAPARDTAGAAKQADFTPAGSTSQTASIQRTGRVVAESFSIYRKK